MSKRSNKKPLRVQGLILVKVKSREEMKSVCKYLTDRSFSYQNLKVVLTKAPNTLLLVLEERGPVLPSEPL